MGKIAIPQPILDRQKLWKGKAPHPSYRRFAFAAGKKLAIADPGARRTGVDEKAMSATFVISTINSDRGGDVMIPEGCYLENYKNAAIVSCGHFLMPRIPLAIGSSNDAKGNLRVTINPGVDVRATCRFCQEDADSVKVWILVKNEILTTASIGFSPWREMPRRRGDNEPTEQSLFPGFEFKYWELHEWAITNVPMNPFATLVRSYIARGKIESEPIGSMMPFLKSLSEPTPAWSPGATLPPGKVKTKTSGVTDLTPAKPKSKAMHVFTRKTLLSALPKSWKAAMDRGRKRWALKVKLRKAMEESSGTAGGYTSGKEDPLSGAAEPINSQNKPHGGWKEIQEVAEKHKEGAGEPHDFYHKAFAPEEEKPEEKAARVARIKAGEEEESHEVYHHHAADAEPEHLEAVKNDLMHIDGMKAVTQSTEPPEEGSGFEKCYPKAEEPEANANEEEGKAAATLAKLKAAMDEDDVENKDDEATMGEEAGDMPEEGEGADKPHGVETWAATIEFLQGELGRAEPEVAEGIQQVLDAAMDIATTRYPDEKFGGEEEAADEPEKPEEETEEAMAAYRSAVATHRKAKAVAKERRLSAARLKRLSKNALSTIKAAVDQFGDFAKMEAGDEFTRAHKAACKMHCSELGGLHKALSGPEEAEAPEEKAKDTLDLKAIGDALGDLNKRADSLGNGLYALTGKR